MSLSSDLQADLENVFFGDFENTATVGGDQITGFLSQNSHQFLDLDTNQYVFSGPIHQFPSVKRETVLVIDGKKYLFITARPQGETQYWIVEPK
jgi:hypothetical protein